MSVKGNSAISYFLGVMVFVVAATAAAAVARPQVASAAGTKILAASNNSSQSKSGGSKDSNNTSKKTSDSSSKDKKSTKTASTNSSSSNNSAVVYHYVAQPGDSYTWMARKAVETYGLKYKVNLSGAQIVFAVTNLTQEAGSPLLNEGQQVSVSENAIKNWVDKAKNLTPAEEAAWQVYVPSINFNTDHVGQA